MSQSYNKNTVLGIFTPNKEAMYTITADLYGYCHSKVIDVYNIEFSAPEVTTFTNVPVEFKLHLNGDKKHTANQKVRVHLGKDYYLITDENGDGSVVLDDLNLNIGSYPIGMYCGDFSGKSKVNIITTIFAEDVVQVLGDQVTFKAQFTNNTGSFLKMSTKVKFTLDGKNYYSVINNENGTASVDFQSLSRGEHKILVTNPDNGESKFYRIVILMGVSGTHNGINQSEYSNNNFTSNDDSLIGHTKSNQSVNSRNNFTTNDDSLMRLGKTSQIRELHSDFTSNFNDVSNVESNTGDFENQTHSKSPSKSINASKTISNNNNMYLMALLVLVVVLGAFAVRKMKK